MMKIFNGPVSLMMNLVIPENAHAVYEEIRTTHLLETFSIEEALNRAKVLIKEGISAKAEDGKLKHHYMNVQEFREHCHVS